MVKWEIFYNEHKKKLYFIIFFWLHVTQFQMAIIKFSNGRTPNIGVSDVFFPITKK